MASSKETTQIGCQDEQLVFNTRIIPPQGFETSRSVCCLASFWHQAGLMWQPSACGQTLNSSIGSPVDFA
ncbi:hypothetical protein A6X21_05185 [Planctopirus hydrillae]|uniref:Uncharacterized protein n=1 Tax=Planctopirus hydrillae TaxID=1841610 RepID=A0A1C3EDK5_9PLAN|nr:hypothetical protein A6X21_05185 [Planctopirus hydrillae]